MANTETSTATTPVMPMTMTLEAPSRCGSVCRFMTVIAISCLNTLVLSRECIDDVQALRAQRGRQSHDECEQHRDADAGQQRERREFDALQPLLDDRQRAVARGESQQ